MKRRHLFEFEDQAWFPALLRDAVTDFLREALVVGNRMYAPVVPLLERTLKHSGTDTIIDLCSGGSGPWAHLKADLAAAGVPVTLVLTDKYPNLDAFAQTARAISDGRVTYHQASVDARQVPEDLDGVRTLFTALHHFRPEQAQGILADAYHRRVGIGIFEFSERRPQTVLTSMVLAPTLVLLTMPKLRPDWRRLALTYLLPVIPAATTWDAVVSNLRTYTVDELREMVRDFDDPGYAWEVDQLPGKGRQRPVTYLLGYPTDRDSATRTEGTS